VKHIIISKREERNVLLNLHIFELTYQVKTLKMVYS